ncbi:PAS domain-containing protein [Haloplanus litoreus]|uniref:PAS domain-containing protein n=2 Tax=Haloplanus litoreus TaxID=767515 RepID=A0ABD6A2I4_9EURY
MDEAPVGITISNPALPDNPVIYANAAFERITGYPVEEVIGRNCRFLQERIPIRRRSPECAAPSTTGTP